MPNLEEAQRRHAAYYVAVLTRMQSDYLDRADHDRVVVEFETEWEQLQTAHAWAAGVITPGTGDVDLAFGFAAAAEPLVGLRRRPDVVRAWLMPSLAHPAVMRDPWAMAENLNRVGQTHYNAGEFDLAAEMYRRALDAHRRGDPSEDPRYYEIGEAGYTANLGAAEERRGDRGAARSAYEHARTVLHHVGESAQEGRMWTNLGTLLAEEDAHEEALDAYTRAFEMALEAHDTDGRELALGAAGNSLADLKRLDEARATLEQALELARALGDKARQALRLGSLANVLWLQGDYAQALQHRSEALALAREMSEPRAEALQLHGIGQVRLSLGEYVEAGGSFADAERLFQAIGMTDAAARSRWGITEACKASSLRSAIDAYREHVAKGRYEEALEAIDRWRALGYEPTQHQRSVVLGLRGFAESAAGRINLAAELLAEALALDRELPDRELAARHLGNVGDIYRQLGDADNAERAYSTALEFPCLPDDLREQLTRANRLAQALGSEGRVDDDLLQDLASNLGVRDPDDVTQVEVTYNDGCFVRGQLTLADLSAGAQLIVIELQGGLPLRLVLSRIASIRFSTALH